MMKSLIVILSLLFSTSGLFSQSEEQSLAETMRKVMGDNPEFKNGNSVVEGLPKGMESSSAADRIQMIASYLFQQTGGRGYSDTALRLFLKAFPNVLTEDSGDEVRKLLREEKDPRRFYLLNRNLANPLHKQFGQVFISYHRAKLTTIMGPYHAFV